MSFLVALCRSRVVPIISVDDARRPHSHGAVRVIADNVFGMLAYVGDVAHIAVVSVVMHMWLTVKYTCRVSPTIYINHHPFGMRELLIR